MNPFDGRSLDAVRVRREVEEIWKIVLEVSSVDPEDSFFGLGGDSLNAVEIITGVEQRLGLQLDPVEVMDYPVFKDFAEFVVRCSEENSPETASFSRSLPESLT